MVKNLVRLALASEYSRTPIKRSDVLSKIQLSESRQFKIIFEQAQVVLRATFGMELVELPAKDRVTLTQKKAASKSQSQGTSANSNKMWVLSSVLPKNFREAVAVEAGPSKIPTTDAEGAYVGLYSFIISLVMLSGGQLPEAKLERHLRRCNADQTTPVDKTDKLLARMLREGYLIKVKDTSGGEEVIEYFVGPRGKVEVGQHGVAGLFKRVYDLKNEPEEVAQELNRRLERSFKFAIQSTADNQSVNGNAAVQSKKTTKKGKQRRKRQQDSDSED